VLGIFAKDPIGMSVKTRLRLPASVAANFYRACLADTIETACCVAPAPVLFLALEASADLGPTVSALRDALFELGLDTGAWRRLRIERQEGHDLGERLQRAFDSMHERPACIVGSDSPSLPASMLERALRAFDAAPAPDLVLGPSADGGYYLIGCRHLPAGLLRGIGWSSARTLADTRRRAEEHDLRVAMLEPWTDVDVPQDVAVLRRQIATVRSQGDGRTARHVESALHACGTLLGES